MDIMVVQVVVVDGHGNQSDGRMSLWISGWIQFRWSMAMETNVFVGLRSGWCDGVVNVADQMMACRR